MTPEDRRKAIEYLVFDVHLPRFNSSVAFLVKGLHEKWKQAERAARLTGLPFQLPPTRIDLTGVFSDLVNDIVEYELIISKKEKPDEPI